MDNGLDAAVKLIEAGQRSDPSKFIIDIAIDLYDILENYDSQTADRIHAILSQSVLLTESQVLALINKTYEKLQKRKFDFYLKVQYNNIIEKIKKYFFLNPF